ncbi:hypothetical protein D3C77_392000 [compost metagenome]
MQAVSGLNAGVNGSTGTFGDIKVSFTKPNNETNIKEYRILVIPTLNANGYTLGEANRVGSFNYTTVPVGTNSSAVAVTASGDVYGNAINNSTTYQIKVLTVAKAGDQNNVLSEPSGQVKVAPAPPVLKDVAPVESATVDNSAGSALVVNFSAPADITNIDSYTVVAVPAGVGAPEPRTVADVDALATGKVTASPSGNGLSATVTQDTQGNAIDTTTKTYKIFIVSNAKQGSAISVVREVVTTQIKATLEQQIDGTPTPTVVPTSDQKESTQLSE